MKKELLKYVLAFFILFGILSLPSFSRAQEKSVRPFSPRPLLAPRELPELRERLKQSTENDQPEERLTKMKEFLRTLVDRLIERLNQLKETVSSNSNIPSEKKEKILADISERISSLVTHKSEIEQADSISRLQSIGDAIRESLPKQKNVMQGAGKTQVVLRTQKILEKMNSTSDKTSSLINKLKALGLDVSDLESQNTTFTTALEKAKEKFSAGQATLEAGSQKEGIALIKEGQATLKEAVEASKLLVASIKTHVQEFRNLRTTK